MSRFRRLLRWALIGSLGALLLGGLALALLYWVIASKLPDVASLRNVELQEPLYVYARDGRLMAMFGETRRYPVDIAKVPERVKQAFIAVEDARFYEHHGVDYKGVGRAIWLLATTDDRRVPGGSTITQQVARQFFLSSEYSYTRKLREMLLAWRMEQALSKDEILELYLNKSFFGNRAYGVAAAAEFYYGKPVDQLSLDETASLAAIPKFPSSGNPISNPERARERRDYVLARMLEQGYIDAPTEQAARAVQMHAVPHERPVEVYAPYVAEMVRQQMIERFGGDVLTRGYHVTTTIDPTLQAAGDAAVRNGLATYDHRHGWRAVEQHFDLAADEDAATAAARLRGIPPQSGLMPAVVLRADGGTADVVLADGTQLTLDASNTRPWPGRSPSALYKRGDLARVRKVEPPKKEDGSVDPEAKPTWRVDQLPQAQAALISLDADTGALRALVGGYSFAGNKFNRATQARRQPGSSFKPFVYAAAFEKGFNPASIVLDAPVVFNMRNGKVWRPQNDSGNFAGPMRIREALVQSRNLVSVRLLDAIGVDYARRYISHFGLDEALLPPNLSMSLGTASLPPIMVAGGYATFVNGGYRVTPWLIDRVTDRNGKEVFKEKPPTACPGCAPGKDGKPTPVSNVVGGFDLGPAGAARPAPVERSGGGKGEAEGDRPRDTAIRPSSLPPGTVVAPRAIDGRVAYQMVSMMRDVVQRGTGTAAKVLGREDVGGKTGSTNDHRDAWFGGFGAQYATVVWVGRDNFQSLGYREYGGKAALPIWIDYMRVALKDKPVALNDPPDGMVQATLNGVTEWVKVEDMDRIQDYDLYGPEDAVPDEEAFDIF